MSPTSRNIARATTHVVGWGDAFYDIDNDGWLDLIAVNGHVYPQVDQAKIGINFREPGQLFLNQRDGTFRDVSDQVGPALKVPRVGRGLAIGDLFNDGVQEVVVENLEGRARDLSSPGRTAQPLDQPRTRPEPGATSWP